MSDETPVENVSELKSTVETTMWAAFGVKVKALEEERSIREWTITKGNGGSTPYMFSFPYRGRTIASGGDNPVHAVQEADSWLLVNKWDQEASAMEMGQPYLVEHCVGYYVKTTTVSPSHAQVPHCVLLNVMDGTSMVVNPAQGCRKTTWEEVAKAQDVAKQFQAQ